MTAGPLPTVVLLNPPGSLLYIRNYFCSQTSKARFINQPIDLIFMSGWLKNNFHLVLIDAVLEGISPDSCLKKICALNPAAIITLCGQVSWKEDEPFLKRLKEKTGARLIAIGDNFIENPAEKLRDICFIDAIITDFSNDDSLSYLSGKTELIKTMTWRNVTGNIVSPRISNIHAASFSLPLPKHDLFVDAGYSFPFVRQKRYATVLTDYGCPCTCSFCVMSTLGYKIRPLENVVEELEKLKAMGVNEILFIDQTFGAVPGRMRHLLRTMIDRRFGFSWVCFSRVDRTDVETLSLMKNAGCHTIIYGVESANENILRKYRKGYSLAQIRETFSECRKLGIQTAGTFLLGFPEDDAASIKATVDLAIEIDCDYASFNVASPRPGTEFRRMMIEEHLADSGDAASDQAGRFVHVRTRHLDAKKLARLQRQAMLRFYFRPRYLLKRLKALHSWRELFLKASEAWAVFRRGILGR
ncbi:MAG: radical SAM protein [Candidatus Riflebacteria bacterium]|nr:radical SAM protein [Candidatus Riflebacteria bacterium]